MIRMWFLIRYLGRYKDPNRGDHWLLQAKPTQHFLIAHLIFERHFIEDWRDKFLRYFYIMIRRDRPSSKLGAKLSQRHWKSIEDIIKKCIDRNLIQYSKPTFGATSSNTHIWTDNKSREFLRPFRFIEAVLKEYGHAMSFTFGAGGTFIVWLIVNFWDLIRAAISQ